MSTIVIVANKYPNRIEPNACVFIQQLVWTFADLHNECIVIAPMPVNLNWRYVKYPEKEIEITENGNEIAIYHPKYFSLGQSGSILQKKRVLFTTNRFEKALDKFLKKYSIQPDIFYAHFLCPAGVVVSRLGKKYGVPAFMAHGEALYVGDKKYGNDVLARELTGLKGVIAVSSQNKDYVVRAGIVPEQIVQVFPNGYRKERFFKRDRTESRKKFGLPLDAFIVGMCGSFDERKGINRIQDAVDQLDDVYFVCAGKGDLMPTSSKCLWAKPVNNEDLPWFYSALDIFLLPTQNEGCCNAIVEAIACECPIISSDRSFNYDICDKSNSILIDPDSVDEIKTAVTKIKNDDAYRLCLSEGSKKKACSLGLESRAKSILGFMLGEIII